MQVRLVHLWVDFRVFSFLFLNALTSLYSAKTLFLRCAPFAFLLSNACFFSFWHSCNVGRNVVKCWMRAVGGQSNLTTIQKTVTTFSPFRKKWWHVWNRPSILCVTHNKRNYSAVPTRWWIISVTSSIHAKSRRYLRYISANFFGFSAKF